MTIGPAPILGVLVGVLHTALFVFIRGESGGRRLPIVLLAAVLGAFLGDAIGERLGIELLSLGDFHLLSASLAAWAGIIVVAIAGVLAPGGSPYARR